MSHSTTTSPARPTTVASDRRGLWTGVDQASVMGVELIAAILTWTGIGYLVDRSLGTGPWFLAVGALIGNAAGLYLVWLRSARMAAADDARRAAGNSAQDPSGGDA